MNTNDIRNSLIDITEIVKLGAGLMERGLNFSVKGYSQGAILIPEDGSWDAICHIGSYGHEQGLLEVMGKAVCREEYDSVEGWLTAETILQRLDENKYWNYLSY